MAVLAGTLIASVAAADIFSPGDLAKGHVAFEGISQCTQCHPAGGQLSQEKCLDCHTELKPRVEKGVGFHGHIATEKRACETCHADHRGRAFQMIDWGTKGQKGFDHARAFWPLEGKHLEATCDKCHQRRRILSAAIVKLIERSPERNTMLGLGRDCKSCHFDDHRGQVGDDCGACHAPKGWKPAEDFSHAHTDYPLTGKHLKVKCEGCHPTSRDQTTPKGTFPAPVSETFMKFTPIESRSCLDCHKDFHDGKFGQRCQSCHTVDGWKIIRNASAERAFHEKTRFPLKGEHLDVACVACHGPFPGQKAKFKGLAFEQCAACHADAHEGQLTVKGGKAPDCEGCHTVERFMPPRFALEQHQKTTYPLEGAHQVVACNACHLKSPALVDKIPKALRLDLKRKKRPELFSFASFEINKPLEKCDSCHTDVHRGQLAARECGACHGLASFKKVQLDHDRDTRYPLTGKHATVACNKCHGAPTPDRPVQYRPLPMTCASCHEDVHSAQLAKNGVTDCESCHRTTSWKETKFLHQPPFTDFALDGKHAEVKCEGCHRRVQLSKTLSSVRYKPLPQTCESCHSDFHQGAFKGFEP
jgi:hypothetical protein